MATPVACSSGYAAGMASSMGSLSTYGRSAAANLVCITASKNKFRHSRAFFARL